MPSASATTKQADLPPLPPGKARNPNASTANEAAIAASALRQSSRPPSERGSSRGGSARGDLPLVTEDRTSQRSQAQASSRRSGSAGRPASHQSASTAGRSITSSVALSKLQQLEDMLLEERRARENAELTLLTMQREKLQRDDSVEKGAQAQKQLGEVMAALQRVLTQPDDSTGIIALRNIVRGVPPPRPPPKRTTGQQQQQQQAGAASAGAVDTGSNRPGEDRSFLDNIGHFDREKKRANANRRGGAGVTAQ